MKIKLIILLLALLASFGFASSAFAADSKPSDVWNYWTLESDPIPPTKWNMNPTRTKYIGDGCWRDWKVVKCTPYGNYGKYRYNPNWNK